MSQVHLKLLHVEDDDGDAMQVRRAVRHEFGSGHELVRVHSLREAIERLKEDAFDVILLDLNLTDKRGIGNVNAIQEENPELPIVVLSGHDDTELALEAVRQGAQEYMVKDHTSSRSMGLAVRSSIERKSYERELFRMANHDQLTGLPNRRMFMEYLRFALLKASRWERIEAVMFMDVNDFKKVNDAMGHDAGDMLLEQVAARLKTSLRASDLVARYAGDEFVVHLDGGTGVSRETCQQIAEKVTDAFREPISVGAHEIDSGLSIGVALYPEHGREADELIQSADRAMYVAKRGKLGYWIEPSVSAGQSAKA